MLLATFLAACAILAPGLVSGAGALLTTQATDGGPTIIVDGGGNEVVFHGIGWYGINIGFSAPADLSQGADALSQDFKQIVYRQKALGLNSIRLAFSFDSVHGLGISPVSYTSPCTVPSVADIQDTLVPSAANLPDLPLNGLTVPPEAPPAVPGGICNADMPNNSTYERFIWIVNYYISEGFYVNLDFHANAYLNNQVSSQESFFNQAGWVSNWVKLVSDILQTPAAEGKLLIDLINEPDGLNLVWSGDDGLTTIYTNVIDALYEVCPGCLFLVEGGGQSDYCGINWGNGFATTPGVGKSDATPFFTAILQKPWLNQVVLAPHVYCPAVTLDPRCFDGESRWSALDVSFGYLTVAPGFCSGSTCRVFPAILDEFGSTLGDANEVSCLQSIQKYAAGTAETGTKHAPIKSWFFWAWQPNSEGTGGLVTDDWKTVQWGKINALSGGIDGFGTGFGLRPWYLEGASSAPSTPAAPTTPTATPAAASSIVGVPVTNLAAPTASTPAATPVPTSTPTPVPVTNLAAPSTPTSTPTAVGGTALQRLVASLAGR